MNKTYGTDDAMDFICGLGKDHISRTVEDYLQFDKHDWEECHNHVQWAFPSHIVSAFNPYAPVVDMEYYSEVFSNPTALYNTHQLILNYLESLGIYPKYSVNGMKPTRLYITDHFEWVPDFTEDFAHWVSFGNHNYLRLTRLLNLMYHSRGAFAPFNPNHLLICLAKIVKSKPTAFTADTMAWWVLAANGKL